MKKVITIPEPCHEDWNKMTPTEKGAFCKSCQKEVHDFTNKSKQEAEEIIDKAEGKVCGRFRKDQISSSNNFTSMAIKSGIAASLIFSTQAAITQNIIQGEPTIDTQIQQPLTIAGSIFNQQQNKLSFAICTLYKGNEIIQITHANQFGNFSFRPVHYSLEELHMVVSHEGYENEIILLSHEKEYTIKVNMASEFVSPYLPQPAPPALDITIPNIEDLYTVGDIVYEEVLTGLPVMEEIPIDTIIGDTVNLFLPEIDVEINGHIDSEQTKKDATVEKTICYTLGGVRSVSIETIETRQPEEKVNEGTLITDSKSILYPNPTEGLSNLKMDEDGNYLINIYHNNGQLLNTNTFSGTAFAIDLTSYENGWYLIEVINQDTQKKFVHKLVKY